MFVGHRFFVFIGKGKGLVTHNDIQKIYRIIQYFKNIFKCNMVKNIFKIYKDKIFTQKNNFCVINKVKPV